MKYETSNSQNIDKFVILLYNCDDITKREDVSQSFV